MSKKSKKGRFVTALILSSLVVALQATAQPQLVPGRGFLTGIDGVPQGAVDVWSDEQHGLFVLTTSGCVWQQPVAKTWTKLFCESDLKGLDERNTLVKPPVVWPAGYGLPYNGELHQHTQMWIGYKSLYFSTLCPVQYSNPTTTQYAPCVLWRFRDYKTVERLVGNGDILSFRNNQGLWPGFRFAIDGVKSNTNDDPIVAGQVSTDGVRYTSGHWKLLGNRVFESVMLGSVLLKGWEITSEVKLLTANTTIQETDLSQGTKRVIFPGGGDFLGDKYSYWRFVYTGNSVLMPYMPYSAPGTGFVLKPDRLVVMDLEGSMKQLVGPDSHTLPDAHELLQVKGSGSLTIATTNKEWQKAPDALWVKLDGQLWRLIARNGDQIIRGLNVSYYLAVIQGCSVVFGTRKSSDTLPEAWYRLSVPCITETKVESERATLRGQNLTTIGNAWAVLDGGTRLRDQDCRRDADDVVSCALSAGDHTIWTEVDGVPSNKVQITVVPTAPPTPTITTLKSADPFTGCALPGAFAPGSLLTLSGNSLAGGEVLVNGQVVPAHAASETEIQFLLPTDLQIGTAKLRVNVAKNGLASASHELELSVVPAAPCLAEGNGLYPLVYDDAGSELRSPALPGQTVLLLSTGLSAGLPAGITMGEIQGLVEMSGLEGQPGVTLLRVTLPDFETTGGNPVERELLLTLGDVQVPIRLTTY